MSVGAPAIKLERKKMAGPAARFLLLLLSSSLAAVKSLPAKSPSPSLDGRYPRIFSFGDSLTDTGNIAAIAGADSPLNILHPPYGNTFFHHPTGRFCDGRLAIDFVAAALGLPFLTPYLGGKTAEDFTHGANFAVGGVTATGDEYGNLKMQVQWFKTLLTLLCADKHEEKDCTGRVMASSLFMVGEIGGNDYNYMLLRKAPLGEIRAMVPHVIDAISAAVEDLIRMGAKMLVIPGNLPIGCVPKYLTLYASSSRKDYDRTTGCLNWINDFSTYHNKKLKAALETLRSRHRNATIVYADYFGAMLDIFVRPHRFGIAKPLSACCGGVGPYNCSLEVDCGMVGSRVCDDPLDFAWWDGFHPTEAAYRVVARHVVGLLKETIGSDCGENGGGAVGSPLVANQ